VDVAVKIFYFLGNKAAYVGKEVVTFRVNLLPAPSGWKIKPSVERVVL